MEKIRDRAPFSLLWQDMSQGCLNYVCAEFKCKMAGSQRMSYPSVVAAGPDAYYTHYGRNDKVTRAGQVVLMDAGCERFG